MYFSQRLQKKSLLPFLPTNPSYLLSMQIADVQLLPNPDDREPLENENMESTLDSDPENLLSEAVRLLQIDNVQILEERLLVTESSLKEKEKEAEVQAIEVELENAQKAYALEMEETMSTHQGDIQALRSELGSAQTAHTLEIEEIRSTYQDEIKTMKAESEKTKKAHALAIEEAQSRHQKGIDAMTLGLENVKQAHAILIDETRLAHIEELKTTESLSLRRLRKVGLLSSS